MPCIWLKHNKRQIFLNVAIFSPEELEKFNAGEEPNLHTFKALLDTGASSTCITKKVADDVGLAPIGKVAIVKILGPGYHNNYLFHVGFVMGRKGAPDAKEMEVSVHVAEMQLQGAGRLCPWMDHLIL